MQSQKRAKENKMAKKKKGGRRAALKGFAKGKFQSPVHSNGYKQDMLIDLHGGDIGLDSAANVRAAAGLAGAAGKSYFKYGGTVYKAVSTGRGFVEQSDDKTGRAT